MRLIFVSPANLCRPTGGRAMLASLHHEALADILGEDFVTFHLSSQQRSGSISRIFGHIDGATSENVVGLTGLIDRFKADVVWLDGSNLGRLAEALRRRRPSLRIFTFCHNVEARFFMGALRRRRDIAGAGVLAANYVAERLAIKFSDTVVALSSRDSEGFKRLYGRSADYILPMAVGDQVSEVTFPEAVVEPDAPLLFVGGAFYANCDGVRWFARHVSPLIDIPVEVVGHGMEGLRAEMRRYSNVTVLGSVDALGQNYRHARASIAPIFDGSGMKTKIAEALMFGKRVIGTAEAFVGYEEVASRVGWRCETPKAFAEAISEARETPTLEIDPSLRALYQELYSAQALKRRLEHLLNLRRPGKRVLPCLESAHDPTRKE